MVEKSGAWFSYGDERIGQGRENSKTFLKDNPQIAHEIEDKIRAAHGLDFDDARRQMATEAMMTRLFSKPDRGRRRALR